MAENGPRVVEMRREQDLPVPVKMRDLEALKDPLLTPSPHLKDTAVKDVINMKEITINKIQLSCAFDSPVKKVTSLHPTT